MNQNIQKHFLILVIHQPAQKKAPILLVHLYPQKTGICVFFYYVLLFN